MSLFFVENVPFSNKKWASISLFVVENVPFLLRLKTAALAPQPPHVDLVLLFSFRFSEVWPQKYWFSNKQLKVWPQKYLFSYRF